MKPRTPWTEAQNAIIRKHYMLTGTELWPMVNAAGPERTLASVMARRAFLDVRKRPHPIGSKLHMAAITARVAAMHGLTVDDLKGQSRKRPVFLARQQAMAEIYATGNFSYPTIGRFFGDRDHSTAQNAVKNYVAPDQQVAA